MRHHPPFAHSHSLDGHHNIVISSLSHPSHFDTSSSSYLRER
jgi:hypothetical protein